MKFLDKNRRRDTILHGRVQKLCQNFKKQNHLTLKILIKYLVCVRHCVYHCDIGVSRTPKVPVLTELPGCLKVDEMGSGKGTPRRGNGKSKGPVV